jgi:hypothetical protein
MLKGVETAAHTITVVGNVLYAFFPNFQWGTIL